MAGTESIAANTQSDDGDIAAKVEQTVARLGEARNRIGRVIYGQDKVIEQCLITLLAGGHGLEILEQTKIVEVKQGPYDPDNDKVLF